MNNEDLKLLINEIVYFKNDKGKVLDASISGEEILLSVYLFENDSFKRLSLKKALEAGSLVFENNYLIKDFYKEEEKKKSYDDLIKILCLRIKSELPVAIELVNLFDNKDFEKEILNLAFLKLYNITNFKRKIESNDKYIIILAATFIAIKYYDGNLMDKILDLYKEYNSSKGDDLTDPSTTLRKIFSEYRTKIKYFDESSYVAVPLVLSAVPYSRMDDLFVIAYDIYKKKLLFDEEVSDDQIEDRIIETFISLRDKGLIEKSDKIKGTEYLMSRYTQSLIYSSFSTIEDLIKIITKCIRLIISYLTQDRKKYTIPKFYAEGFNSWIEKYIEKEKTSYEKSKLKAKPLLFYHDRNLIIEIGEYAIDDNIDIDLLGIEIYENNILKQKIPFEVNDILKSDDAIGGYVIQRKKLLIKCNPINNLSYRITYRDAIIYDSKERLFRKTVFFNEYGKEIRPNSEYNGMSIVITGEAVETGEESVSFKKNGYNICEIEINSEDIYSFDGESYYFNKIKEAKNVGYLLPWIKFCDMEMKNRAIYKSAVFLFRTNMSEEEMYVILDNEVIDGSLYSIRSTFLSESLEYIYSLKLKNIEDGYHSIQIKRKDCDKIINNMNFDFILIQNLAKNRIKTDENGREYEIIFSDDDHVSIKYPFNTSSVKIKRFIKGIGWGEIIVLPSAISYSVGADDWYPIKTALSLFENNINEIKVIAPANLSAYYLNNDGIKKKVALTTDPTDENKYKLSLDSVKNEDLNKCGKIVFQFNQFCQELNIWKSPYVNNCKYVYDKDNDQLVIKVNYESQKPLYLVLKNNSTIVYETKICSGEEIRVDKELLLDFDGAISFALHVPKNSLFKKYEDEAFFTFKEQFILNKKRVKWGKDKYFINRDIKNGIFLLSVSFDVVEKLEYFLYSSDDNILISNGEIKSKELIKIKASPYIESYKISLYENTEPFGKSKEVHSISNLFMPSKILQFKYEIIKIVVDGGKEYSARNSIVIRNTLFYDNTFYLIAQTDGKEMYLKIIEVGNRKLKARMLNKDLSAVLCYGKQIDYIILEKKE